MNPRTYFISYVQSVFGTVRKNRLYKRRRNFLRRLVVEQLEDRRVLAVGDTNDPPIVVNQTVAGVEDTTLTIPSSTVLAGSSPARANRTDTNAYVGDSPNSRSGFRRV